MIRDADKGSKTLPSLARLTCSVSLLYALSIQPPAAGAPSDATKPETKLILVELVDASISECRGQNLTARFGVVNDRTQKAVTISFPCHSFTDKERRIMGIIEKAVSWASPPDSHQPHTAIDHPRFRIPETAGGYTTDFSKWIIVATKPTDAEKQKMKENAATIKEAIEALRKRIPEAKTISEQNGASIADKSGEYFTLTRLAAASEGVPCDTLKDCKILLKYLDDDDQKIRFIAASVLERTLKVHPNGMSMSEIDGKNPAFHKKLLDRFQAKMNSQFSDTKDKSKQ